MRPVPLGMTWASAQRASYHGEVKSGRTMTDTLPRAWLRTCLLIVLTEGPSHGYDMLHEVQAMGMASADTAAVYRALRSMEHDGLVTSEWEWSQAGPSRRSYAITEQGRVEMGQGLDRAAAVHELLGLLLERGAGAGR